MSSPVDAFVRLFRGRADAHGSWEGGCVREPLTRGHFERHLSSPDPSNWIGVYNVIGDRCSWGVVDIDVPDQPLARNVTDALALKNVPAWIEKTTRGYHVWVFPADQLIAASTMRRALTAACHVVGYTPKEVFPKQDKVGTNAFGNYVRTPLNGAFGPLPRAADVRRFLGDPDLEEMDRDRATTAALEPIAAMLPRPQAVDISVDINTGIEAPALVGQLGGKVQKIWRDGPRFGHDRSNTLVRLAYELRAADVEPSAAYAVVASADNRWGKGFADRGERGTAILQRIIEKAYQ